MITNNEPRPKDVSHLNKTRTTTVEGKTWKDPETEEDHWRLWVLFDGTKWLQCGKIINAGGAVGGWCWARKFLKDGYPPDLGDDLEKISLAGAEATNIYSDDRVPNRLKEVPS